MYKIKIGVDEAWRWPWAGPVVACAMTFLNIENIDKKFLSKIKDSKKLSKKQREEIFEILIKGQGKRDKEKGKGIYLNENWNVVFEIGVVDNYFIDEFWIKEATRVAMERAIDGLIRKLKDENQSLTILIDWNDNFKFPNLWIKPTFIIDWDEKVLEISAASIIAKVFRDKLMESYSLIYPNIWFEKHSWYWTKAHIDNINWINKLTNIHRLSYKPIKEILEKKEKLLIHSCCGPDIIPAFQDLHEQFNIAFYWYDPNIHPKKEHDKRLKEFKKICEKEWLEFIEWEYKIDHFFNKTKWLEKEPEWWARCMVCYDFRMEKTAIKAIELWFNFWTTTLNASPKKSFEKLSIIWKNLELKHWIKYLALDFKKNNWVLRSIKYCKENWIYRQDYCWCKFSLPKN